MQQWEGLGIYYITRTIVETIAPMRKYITSSSLLFLAFAAR